MGRAERLVEIARRALAACDGGRLCAEAVGALETDARERVHVLGLGKASAHMVAGLGRGLGGRIARGLVVTKAGHARGVKLGAAVRVRVGGHPEPDARSVAAGLAVERFVAEVPARDVLVVALSGGTSALVAAPIEGLSLAALRQTTRALLGAGVPIADANAVRRRLSRAAGGRLAEACPAARIEVLALSDVLGLEAGGRLTARGLATLGSGPFAPEPESPEPESVARAVGVVRRAGSAVPRAVARLLEREDSSTHVRAPCFTRVRHRILASHATLLAAAADAGREAGYRVRRLGASEDPVEAVADRLVAEAARSSPGTLLVGGGEPTVVLPPRSGRGGRCQTLALLVARGLAERGIAARLLALASDGTDGPTPAAGALVDHSSWSRLSAAGDPARALARADAFPLLAGAGLLVRTGPTGTNVLDLHLCERL
jgi:hydroxypyruvate reductase